MDIQHIKIEDLKPHPLNLEYYEEYDKDDPDNIRLQNSLRSVYEKKGYPNLEIVYIDKNGVVFSGNRRYGGAKEEGLPFLRCVVIEHTFDEKCLTNLKLKKIEKSVLEEYNQPGLKRDEYAWRVVLKKYLSDLNDYITETGKTFTGKMRNEWCAERTNKNPKEFQKMVDVSIKYGRPDLVAKVESGEYSVKDAYNEASATPPKVILKENPNRINWIEYYRDKTKFNNLILPKIKDTFHNQILNISMGGKKLITDPVHGWEQHLGISTNLSNTVMSAVSMSLEEDGYTAHTPRQEVGIEDVIITHKGKKDLNIPGFYPERMEMKVDEFKGHGSATKVYTGGGYGRIVPHPFWIVIYDDNAKRLLVLLSNITKNDWQKHGKKGVMPMSLWAENHFDNKEDWVCLHGDIYRDNKGVIQLQCLPVKGGE